MSHKQNLQHAFNPKVGDFWNEMYCACAVVVEVTQQYVVICEKTIAVDDTSLRWDFSNLTTYNREDFSNLFRYGRIGNDNFKASETDEICNKFWCDVFPEWHLKAVEDFLNNVEYWEGRILRN